MVSAHWEIHLSLDTRLTPADTDVMSQGTDGAIMARPFASSSIASPDVESS